MAVSAQPIINRMSSASAERIYSIDTFRLVSIFFVILHHISAFKRSSEVYPSEPILKYLYYFCGNVRFLPFFFIAAGYFFRAGLQRGDLVKRRLTRYVTRLIMLFFFWSAIYAFYVHPETLYIQGYLKPFKIFYLNILSYMQHPLAFLLKGTIENFWFFPALVMGLTIVVVVHQWNKGKYILPLGLVLYLIALLGKSYAATPFGYHTDFEVRQGPFVSTLFIGIGWILAEQKRKYQLKTGVILLLAGLALQIMETVFLYSRYQVKPMHEYLLGTALFCTGIFIAALARPDLGKNTFLPQWGQLTLGVYLLHMLALKCLSFLKAYFHPIAWDFMLPVMIYVLCIFVTVLLKRGKLTKILVT